MISISASELTSTIAGILVRHGTPDLIAQQVASSLVRSNLVGHDSHGARLVPAYIEKIRRGEIDPGANPVARRRKNATATIDCNRGYGQLGASLGVETVVALARENGIATVTLEEANHVGRIGEYCEQIAGAGCIGLILASGANPGGSVAPYGGSRRAFGTNPIAWGFPRAKGQFPFILDMATSMIAAGKVSLAREQNAQIESGALLDNAGVPSRDPEAFFRGGALVPFGAHKGGGLAFGIEIMVNLLCGFAPAISREYKRGNPVVMTAWNIEAFTSRPRFERLIEELCNFVKSMPTVEGCSEALIPGETEFKTRIHRIQHGIPLEESTWHALTHLSQ